MIDSFRRYWSPIKLLFVICETLMALWLLCNYKIKKMWIFLFYGYANFLKYVSRFSSTFYYSSPKGTAIIPYRVSHLLLMNYFSEVVQCQLGGHCAVIGCVGVGGRGLERDGRRPVTSAESISERRSLPYYTRLAGQWAHGPIGPTWHYLP